MKYPLDLSDEASLILADYLEEYDDINLANEVRNSVLEPNVDIWCYEYIFSNFSNGVTGGFSDGGVGINVFYGVGFRNMTRDIGYVFGGGVGVYGFGVGNNVGGGY